MWYREMDTRKRPAEQWLSRKLLMLRILADQERMTFGWALFRNYAIKRFYFAEGDKVLSFKTYGKTENKWHFYSLTSLLETDYDLEYKVLKRTDVNKGRLKYYPFGYPYGGVTGLIIFIGAFGCKPMKIEWWNWRLSNRWIGTDNFKLTEIGERGELILRR